jgi:hypothetical protein
MRRWWSWDSLWGVMSGVRRVRRRSVGRVYGEDGRRETIVESLISGDGGWSIMAETRSILTSTR